MLGRRTGSGRPMPGSVGGGTDSMSGTGSEQLARSDQAWTSHLGSFGPEAWEIIATRT